MNKGNENNPWEMVYENGPFGDKTDRMQVINGWLYRTYTGNTCTMCFVPEELTFGKFNK